MCSGGSWTYTQSGVTTVITTVACYSNVDSDTDSTCTSCSTDSISFSTGTLAGDTPSIPDGIQIVDGCQQITVVCATGGNPAGDVVYMQVS